MKSSSPHGVLCRSCRTPLDRITFYACISSFAFGRGLKRQVFPLGTDQMYTYAPFWGSSGFGTKAAVFLPYYITEDRASATWCRLLTCSIAEPDGMTRMQCLDGYGRRVALARKSAAVASACQSKAWWGNPMQLYTLLSNHQATMRLVRAMRRPIT